MKKFLLKYKFTFLIPILVALLILVGIFFEKAQLFQTCDRNNCHSQGLLIIIIVITPLLKVLSLFPVGLFPVGLFPGIHEGDIFSFIVLGTLFYGILGYVIDLIAKVIQKRHNK